MKLWSGNWKISFKDLNMNVDEANGKAVGVLNGLDREI